MLKRFALRSAVIIASVSTLVGCAAESEEAGSLTIYSGRSEAFISPFLDAFSAETGIKLNIRYGDSASLAAQLLEEGEATPADVFLSQDAGALGAVSRAGLLSPIAAETLSRVPANFRSAADDWTGVTGRVRVLAYSPSRVELLPKSIDDLTSSKWRGRVGIAPTGTYFQSFLTAFIAARGEAQAERWLLDLKANSPKFYDKDGQIIEAIDSGEIDLGLVNHYYVWEVSEELGRTIDVKVDFFQPGDIGNLVNVSGAAILKSSPRADLANSLISFLLRDESQRAFVRDVHEYSLVISQLGPEGLPKLADLPGPKVNLSQLATLERAQTLLVKVGLI